MLTGKLVKSWEIETHLNLVRFVSTSVDTWRFVTGTGIISINPKNGKILDTQESIPEQNHKLPQKHQFIKHKSEYFIDRNYSEESLVFLDKNGKEKFVIVELNQSNQSPAVMNTPEYKLFHNVRHLIFYDGIGVGFDDERFFGFDVTTGEKTWWIERSELADDVLIHTTDKNGVCVSEGSLVSCYRKH